MDSATLVNSEIEQGSKVISSLDMAHFRPRVAVWMITPEYSDGRLVLASPDFDRTELLKAYEKIARVLTQGVSHFRPPILLLRMRDPFIKSLRELFRTASNVRGMRLGGQMIGNRYVNDAYVFRIE